MIVNDYYRWPAQLIVQDIFYQNHQRLKKHLSDIENRIEQLPACYAETDDISIQSVKLIFASMTQQLKSHLIKENMVVQSFVRRYTKALLKDSLLRKPGYHSACPLIDCLYNEHKSENDLLEQFIGLVNLCALNREEDHKLKQLSDDLLAFKKVWNESIHLENDILFPKIVDMEAGLHSR